MSDAKPKRVQRFGPEFWEQRAGLDWSLWDLWFCVVAVRGHDGDLDALAEVFVEAIRKPACGNGEQGEAKLSHFHDLRTRLDDAGRSASDLASDDLLADTRITNRAREKVTGRTSLEGRACTPAMLDTPRRQLERRARYGHWSSFPSNPAPFFEKFSPTVERKDFVSMGRTFAIASRLERRLGELDGPRRTLPDRLALYRAFHTAGLVLASAADDLYISTRSRDRYLMAARRLGSRAWRPVEAMARDQLTANDQAGSVAVFSAADQPGLHREHLQRLCLSHTGVDLNQDDSFK